MSDISTLFVEHLNDQPSAPSTPTISRAGSPPPGHRFPVINIDENTPLLVASSAEHCNHPTVLPAMALNGVPIELLTGSPRVCRLGIAHISQHNHEARHYRKPPADEEDNVQSEPKIGRKRQVIGILVRFAPAFISPRVASHHSAGSATGHYDPFSCHWDDPRGHLRV
jgi:hypothetical protein